MDSFEQMLIENVKQAIPKNLSIVPQSIPIPFFGDYKNAEACTISINPSYCEFYDTKKNLLEHTNARLLNRKKLHKADEEELSNEDAKLVLESCTKYFSNNPYRFYFDKLEKFLNSFDPNLSYYSGSTVALDLFPWATNPVWSKLSENKQKLLTNNGKSFLKNLLKEKQKYFKYIFINGRTTFNTIYKTLKECMEIDNEIKLLINGSSCEIFFGKIYGIDFICWNRFLNSWHIKGKLDENIKNLAKEIFIKYMIWKNS